MVKDGIRKSGIRGRENEGSDGGEGVDSTVKGLRRK